MEHNESVFRLLQRLAHQPKASQRGLANELGISVGKLNYCLKALMGKGLVKAANFRDSRNKLGYAYVLTPRGIDEKARLTAEFLTIKMAEYEALQREIESLRADAEAAGRPEGPPSP